MSFADIAWMYEMKRCQFAYYRNRRFSIDLKRYSRFEYFFTNLILTRFNMLCIIPL